MGDVVNVHIWTYLWTYDSKYYREFDNNLPMLDMSKSLLKIKIAMTLRFEYTLVNEPMERSSETSSEAPIRIPNEYPSFPKPIFLSSLFSLFISIVIIETITYTIPDLVWLSITPLTIFITVPMVFGGTALGAVWCGKFRQWWRYSEV